MEEKSVLVAAARVWRGFDEFLEYGRVNECLCEVCMVFIGRWMDGRGNMTARLHVQMLEF